MPFAVIFDLDGCLADSEPLSLEAIAAEMRAIGIAEARAEQIRDEFLGVTIAVICARIAEHTGHPCPPDFPDRVESRLFEAYETDLKPVYGARALLEALQAADVPVAIATGGSRKRMQKTLECAGLAGFFEGRGFSAEEVAQGKPAPDLFLHAASQLGAAPEDCVVVEDSPHGIVGAVAAGMRALGFTGGSHLERVRGRHAETLRVAGATDVFATVEALSAALYPDKTIGSAKGNGG